MDFSDEMVNEILKIFQVESEEIISKLNNSLLDLEKRPNNKDAILNLFRDAHSLKGASRMVGFNNVQTVAHKMEDILGLAKENEIALNSKVVDVLYQTVDFLSDLIEKSIEKGKEVYDEGITKQIELLENIKNIADSFNPNDSQLDFNSEQFVKNIDNINSIIIDCLVVLMRIEQKKFTDLIDKLLANSQKLYDIFNKTGPYDIKKCIEDIKVKLEFITKASNNLTIDDAEEFYKEFDNIISKLIPLCETYKVEEIDYYSMAFNQLSEIQEDTVQAEKSLPSDKIVVEEVYSATQDYEKAQSDSVDDWCNIIEKINGLSNNTVSLSQVKDVLLRLNENCNNDDIKNVLGKILEIFDYALTNEIQFDDEIISVLQQSFEYCRNVFENTEVSIDKEFILQRLEILHQVMELNKEKTEEKEIIIPKTYKIKDKKIVDFSDILTSEGIKTLRVDSAKLDVLVNQVNELAITKIKTKKHLHELDIINKELEEWQKTSIKTLSYFKYYDKKYFQTILKDSPISFFIKQLLNLFLENNREVQKTVSNIALLKRTIQEDNIKMGLIVDNVDNMVKNIRILPLATIFHLFGRMVRDIAQEKNKKIELAIIGSETCTDKKIIEEIKNPLIHIIRNSIDHGIETPEERVLLGKNPAGKIILSAHQSSNKVIIEIRDDGRGINLEKIKEKALQKGFLTQEELNTMSDEQIMNIIFAPGFSTGDEITNISGRGIGLDIVQSKIAQLNGRVKILSEMNKGCCVQIELPTSLSITKVFLVKSSHQTFGIPMESIKTVLRKHKSDIFSNKDKKSIIFNNETISMYNLSEILNLPKINSDNDKETIIIIEYADKIMALAVDKLIGDQEILNKKLSAPFYKLKNISGITTLDSGEICLILNISDLLKVMAYSKGYIASGKEERSLISIIYKILLVDDSITTRTLGKNILTKAGYDVELAENPIEAFESMKNNKFDLIISDIEMPEMDGFEFLKKLKSDETFADIPVIMMSSLISEDNKKRAAELKAEKYIVKGEFNQDDFQDTIKEILLRKN